MYIVYQGSIIYWLLIVNFGLLIMTLSSFCSESLQTEGDETHTNSSEKS